MRSMLPILLLFMVLSSAKAQGPLVYGEGQPAPALHIEAWACGDPLSRLEPGRVHIIEFWASWCAASKRAIPRLTALQQSHPDELRVVGISSRDLQGESFERVSALVSELRDAIGYRIAFDDRRRTARAWLDAFDVRSVPTAFVVDRAGMIAWIGNPLWPPGELEEATGLVIAGVLTPADREALHQRHLERRERVSRAERDFEETDQAAQPARALRMLEVLLDLNPDGAPSYAQRKFEILVSSPKTIDEAYRFGREIAAGVLRNDADRLRGMAWTILDDEGLARRDLDLALEAAQRAAELTKYKNAETMDTLALAHFRRGNVPQAIEAEKRAIELTPEEYLRTDMEQRLSEYERAMQRTP